MTNDSPDAIRKRRHRNERIAATILVVIVAAGTAGIVAWQNRITEELREDTSYIPKKEKITPEILLLQEYVRIDTSTPEGAARGARWLHALLAKHGVKAEIIESAPGRLNVYARIRGRSQGDGLLLFNHIDVVSPGKERWAAPPFEARIFANQLWGRGALDMKALALCQLLAFLEQAKRARAPEHDLVFLATCDEETGSPYGMQWIIDHRPDVIAGIRYGLTEGGVTEMLSEQMTYFGIEVGGKQVVKLNLGANDLESLRRARIALEPFMVTHEPERVLPVVEEYFRAKAPTRLAYREHLADIHKTIREGRFWSLPPSYRELTRNTLFVYAPQQTNDGWTMAVVLSNLPGERSEPRLEWLSGIVAPYGVRIAKITHNEGPVPVSPHETPLFEMLIAESKRRYRTEAGVEVLYRSVTDSRFLRPLGIICYGLSPYPVDFHQSVTIHRANERIRLDAFMEGVGFMQTVIRQWSSGL